MDPAAVATAKFTMADDKVIDDEVDAVFESKKKKKKKTKEEGEEGADGATAATEDLDDPDAVFSSKKKKKSSKKEKKEGDEEGGDEEDDVDAVFSSSKKKKKSKSKEKGDGEELVIEEGEGGAGGEGEDEDDLIDNAFDSKKKKKKTKKKKGGDEDGETINEENLTEANYTYDELLQRVQILLTGGDAGSSLPGRVPIKMPPISLVRIGTKKTRWDNFQEICTCMGRLLDHVKQFVEAELGTEGSVDGNHRLVLRGKYVPKYIESLLRKYIGEYVACSTCRSPNTDLTRDAVSRLYFVHCKSCGSSRSVGTIRTGFHAQTRADRRALRK